MMIDPIEHGRWALVTLVSVWFLHLVYEGLDWPGVAVVVVVAVICRWWTIRTVRARRARGLRPDGRTPLVLLIALLAGCAQPEPQFRPALDDGLRLDLRMRAERVGREGLDPHARGLVDYMCEEEGLEANYCP